MGVKMLRILSFILLAVALASSVAQPQDQPTGATKTKAKSKTKKQPAPPQGNPSDCNVAFNGQSRAAVKLRKEADGQNYTRVKDGNVITVSDWFKMTCSLDPQLPPKSKVPEDQPMQHIETQVVTLKGFLMAAKLDGDNDIHTQIAGDATWNSPQLVVEVPPGADYCPAREKVWSLIANDAAGKPGTEHVMLKPVPITVTGYVFVDAFHLNPGKPPCQDNGGRGISKKIGNKNVDKVQGIWEIHPVLKAE